MNPTPADNGPNEQPADQPPATPPAPGQVPPDQVPPPAYPTAAYPPAAYPPAASSSSASTVVAVVAAVVGAIVVVAGLAAVALLGRHTTSGSASSVPAPVASNAVPSAPAPSAAPSAAAPGTCTWSPVTAGNPATKDVGKPPAGPADTTHNRTMTITTNDGVIVIQLDTAHAPCTAASFAYLASKHFFDNTPCHRLTTAGIWVLQCGDPSGTGSGGPAYQFPDENLGATNGTYPRGMVAMANAGPGTNGSQFFLTYKDSPLQPNYTPFGTITQGLDVLDKIAAAGEDDANGAGDGHPKQKVTIKSVTVS